MVRNAADKDRRHKIRRMSVAALLLSMKGGFRGARPSRQPRMRWL